MIELAICLLLGISGALRAAPQKEPAAVSLGADGKLVYNPDSRGNRIPDFSYCGYARGEKPIPNIPVRVVVSATAEDSTRRIQRALDYVGSLPVDTNGFRGAILLSKGRHEVAGGLRLSDSGVVLRGQGTGEDGTVLVATGLDRRTLIRVVGRNDRTNRLGKTWKVQDTYVPVGAKGLRLENARELRVGDTISLTRPSTAAWIERPRMNDPAGRTGDGRVVWKPGSRDICWDRVITRVQDDFVEIDAPISTALEAEFGSGTVEAYSWPGRIENIGIENVRCETTFEPDNPKDENHSWCAITMENAQNCWVRQVTASHFAGSAVAIYESCKCVTVQDCLSLEPISEEGGYRRHTFFTMGQLTLFLRCHAEHGRHDFSVGHCAAGPNAFVQCESTVPLGDSGPIESWASGVLYDGVSIDGNGLSLANRGPAPHGAGWSAANCVLWQCSASFIRCMNPPTARNWAFGCWAEFEGDGIWRNSNEFVQPKSLYLAQLADRLGEAAANRAQLTERSTRETTNPPIEEVLKLAAASRNPAPRLADFIATASRRDAIPTESSGAKEVEEIPVAAMPVIPRPRHPIVITNGWIVCDGKLLIGARTNVVWWRGNIRPAEAHLAEPCLTRFVAGRIGPGFTDDLPELAERLSLRGVVALDHHYGLWYDRRRDDHERVRRQTGDVWPPFYELPFGRSGQGTAWDGLSRYDLTKYNPCYWGRLKEFADLCDEKGLVLFHQNYFQHNILEAGAHWADFPWRSANNINGTGFPEPPPYAGDKRIFMAEQFYDVSQPVRRKLHRAYIRQCLDNFKENSNVIQFTSAEYTGPLEFTQFWLDTVGEWEKETGNKPLIALSCTKDVQDAILGDREHSRIVDLVDFRYWWMTDKGTFAPKGGQNLAPRQFERQWKGGRPNDNDLAKMAADYRHRFPSKPLICDFAQAGWAFLCAGGSMPNLPKETDTQLLRAIPRMQPWQDGSKNGRWTLREPGRQYLIYAAMPSASEIDLRSDSGSFLVKVIEPVTGAVTAMPQKIPAGQKAKLPEGRSASAIIWLVYEN
jgi:hypothetical protein